MDSEVSAMSRAIDLENLSTHGPDEENLFVPVDVTREAKGYEKWINDHIWHLNRMQKQPDEVVIVPSDQCCDPYECWYYGYCHNDE